jgi:hypothetical protein
MRGYYRVVFFYYIGTRRGLLECLVMVVCDK